jgi:hypothetical protein
MNNLLFWRTEVPEWLLQPIPIKANLGHIPGGNRSRGSYYVLVAAGNAEAGTDLFNAEVIDGWMFLNHVLSVKGFSVINGFSDLLTPFLGAAGAENWL